MQRVLGLWLLGLVLVGAVLPAARAQTQAPIEPGDPREAVIAAVSARRGEAVSRTLLRCDTPECEARAEVLAPLYVLPPGGALDPFAVAEAWSRLTRTELFRSVTVSVEADPEAQNRVQVAFDCVLHVLVTDVDVEYVRAASFWYPKQFEAQIKKRLLVHKGAPYLLDDPEVLERQRQNVLELYERQGYEGSEVLVVPTFEGPADSPTPSKRVRVKVLIREGEQDVIGEVLLQGNTNRSYARALSPVQTGERADFWREFFQFIGVGTYERRKFRDQLREVERRYRDEGFFAARVRLDGLIETKGRVYPLVRVFEGPHVQLEFEGARALGKAALRAVTTFGTAGAIDDTEVAASQAEILSLYQASAHYYARITARREVLERDRQRIVFTVDEGPKVYVETVELEGAQRVKADTLRRLIETRGVGKGGVVSALSASRAVLQDARVVSDLAAIRAVYQERGYPGVRFRCMPEGEDPEVWQARSRIASNKDPLDRRAGRFDQWLDDPTRSRCFRVERSPDARFVRVVVELVEGLRTTTDRLAVDAFFGAMTTEVQDEFYELLRRLGFTNRLRGWRKGVGLNRQKLASVEGFLLRWYRTQGYTFARVEAQCGDRDVPDRPCTEAALYGLHLPVVRFQVDTGPRTVVQGILLRGNLVTDSDVVEDELVFKRGAPLSTEDLFLSQANLRSLGTFDSVKVETVGAEETVTSGERRVPTLVTVDVEESTYRLLDGNLGLRIDSVPLTATDLPILYVLGAAVRDRNLAGRALEVGLEGEHDNRIDSPGDTLGDDARWLVGPYIRDRRFLASRLALELRLTYGLGRTDARDQYEQSSKIEATLSYDFLNLSYPAQWGRGLGAQLTSGSATSRDAGSARPSARPSTRSRSSPRRASTDATTRFTRLAACSSRKRTRFASAATRSCRLSWSQRSRRPSLRSLCRASSNVSSSSRLSCGSARPRPRTPGTTRCATSSSRRAATGSPCPYEATRTRRSTRATATRPVRGAPRRSIRTTRPSRDPSGDARCSAAPSSCAFRRSSSTTSGSRPSPTWPASRRPGPRWTRTVSSPAWAAGCAGSSPDRSRCGSTSPPRCARRSSAARSPARTSTFSMSSDRARGVDTHPSSAQGCLPRFRC
jgi:outer membrane protein assembly factor BamA